MEQCKHLNKGVVYTKMGRVVHQLPISTDRHFTPYAFVFTGGREVTDVNGWWALRNPEAATLHYYGLHEWGTITTRIERSPGFISYIRMYIEGCQVAQLLPYLLSLSLGESSLSFGRRRRTP